MYLFLLILIVVSYCRDFFSLIFEQSHCISSCSFSKLWIYYCPELCVNLFLGIWAEALDIFFFPLQSHKCPKGVDKELEFCVTTIREFWLCFLSLYLLEITENHTTILVTQFGVSWKNGRWALVLGLHPSLGDWLRGAVLISVFAPHMLLIWVQHTLISTLYWDHVCCYWVSSNRESQEMFLPCLSYHLPCQRPKEKLQQSKLTLIVLLKINSEKGLLNRR